MFGSDMNISLFSKTSPNTKWRSAEHVLTSRLQNEPPEGVLGSSFTPGDPFTVKAGVTINLNLW